MTLSNLAPVVNDYEAIKDQIDLLTERLDALKAIIRDGVLADEGCEGCIGHWNWCYRDDVRAVVAEGKPT